MAAAVYAGLNPSGATFIVIALGALGCWAGGVASDRWGRTTLTMVSMAFSGACAVAIGLTFGGPPLLTLAVAVVWGVSASAVLPALTHEWALGPGGSAGLMIAVQAGFIVGTLASALVNLPDVFSSRLVMTVGITLGGSTGGVEARGGTPLGLPCHHTG